MRAAGPWLLVVLLGAVPASAQVRLDSDLGRAVMALCSQDVERLRAHGFGSTAGVFTRLDPDTGQPLRPPQNATKEEIERLVVVFERATATTAKEAIGKMGITLPRHPEPLEELERHLAQQPGVVQRMLESNPSPELMKAAKEAARDLDFKAFNRLFDGTSGGPGTGGAVTGRPGAGSGADAGLYQPQEGVGLMQSQDPGERRAGVALLVRDFGFSSGKRLIDAAANDPDPRVRREAVHFLGELGSPPMLLALEDRFAKENSPDVRAKILLALNRSGDAKAIALAREVVRGPEGGEVGEAALQVLTARFSSPRVSPKGESGVIDRALSIFGLRTAPGDATVLLHPDAPGMFDDILARYKRKLMDIEGDPMPMSRINKAADHMVDQSYLVKYVPGAGAQAQKQFFAALRSEEALYAGLAMRELPDLSVGLGLYERLKAQLKERGASMGRWVREQDPSGVHAQNLFLKLSEMEFLPDALKNDPDMVKALERDFFAPASLDSPSGWSAIRIGSFFDCLYAADASRFCKSFPPQAREAVLRGALARWQEAEPGSREKRQLGELLPLANAFYQLNDPAIAKAFEQRAVPDFGVLSLRGKGGQPAMGIVAFDNRATHWYSEFQADALKAGFTRISPAEAVRAGCSPKTDPKNSFAMRRGDGVVICGRYVPEPRGGAWEESFREELSRSRFVAMRGEPWFMERATEGLKTLGPGAEPQLVQLGGCYSIRDVQNVRAQCPECPVVANIKVGRAVVNTPVLFTLLDELHVERPKKSWKEIHRDSICKRVSGCEDVIGPWSFGYALSHELSKTR